MFERDPAGRSKYAEALPILALILNEFNFAEEGNGFKEGIVIIIFATFINSIGFLYRHVL
jgi:hypothetical protein